MLLGIGHFYRLARAGYILAREGVFANLDPNLVPPAAAPLVRLANLFARSDGEGAGRALVRALSEIGPSYVKLGQFLATRPDVVGGEIADALTALQDRMAPFGREEAVAIVEKALGKKIDEVYTFFGDPVAAASVAQVHMARARYADGERQVAVKVLRPGVEGQFARDLRDMYLVARIAERWSSEGRRLRMIEVVDTLARTVKLETDFRLEAAAASEFAENVAKDPDIHVPHVDWDRTAREVLTLEWIDGAPLSDLERVAADGHDLKALGAHVLQSFLRHAMRDGFFHADMHQGNLFVDRQGRLIAIDFGIMGRLGAKERRFLAEILYGFITRDYKRVAEVHFEAGYVPAKHSIEEFSQALRAIGEPLHTVNAEDISMARLLTLLFEVTALFDMRTRTELVLLQKTMVVAEGVARTLDPRLNIWKTCDPVVRSWIEENLGPKAKLEDAGKSIAELARLATHLPKTLADAEIAVERISRMADQGVDLSPQALEGLADTRRRSDNRLLVGIAALLLLGAWLFG
ncbi:2-polyprenylphenol 6-hydroxylase [Methylocystis sp. WRRC1]|uniref:2-polyprenylphenol 6-hydroxylase n=1 Tax=Methylocystis sp. WRRC1 TaxID=1732014 RepID=UPI001D1350DF|nr:2-polyprenylphenol 6-hydroxylase [Methylocystis sp. WRRC1]